MKKQSELKANKKPPKNFLQVEEAKLCLNKKTSFLRRLAF
jgi:hypothetical protein